MDYSKNPVIAVATDIEFSIGAQIVLDKASVTIHQGERIGLVGRNGSGKSSFLKILAGEYELYTGEIDVRKGVDIGFLSQEFTLDESKTVRENILDGAEHLVRLQKEYKSLPPNSPKLHEIETKLTLHEGWDLERKIDDWIEILGAPDKEDSIVTLSGGEKRRVALIRALISDPELLILDEPTNHLDMQTIEWMENFLLNYKGTCIFVTHDRYFLDRLSTRIIELAQGVFYSHNGNYKNYLEDKATRIEIAQNTQERREKFLEQELEWIRRGPKARTTKSKSRIDRFYDLKTKDGAEQDPDMDLVIPPAPRLGKKVVEMTYVGMKYGDRKLFQNFTFRFQKGDKIGIIGANGLGKTTLLKIILGKVRPSEGKVEIGNNVYFNYVDQEKLRLNEDNTVFQEVGGGFDYVMIGEVRVNLWTYLRRFLFEDERINTLIRKLSGGERSRVMLAKILKNGGNFIILDEPTNDLDLATLRVLEEALIDFEGCVLVVSHDRYFLNRVCTGILAFEGNGKVHYSVGDYDFYSQKLKERRRVEKQKEQEEKPKSKPKKRKSDKPKIRKLSYKEKKELEDIEERILEKEEEVNRVEQIFSSPDFYENHGDRVQELTENLDKAREEAEKLYERWAELEKIAAGGVPLEEE